jgi:hypothetical protein
MHFIPMYHHLASNRYGKIAAVFLMGFAFHALSPAHAQSKTKETGPLLRVICTTALIPSQEVVIASRAEDGTWQEYGSLKLRSSSISEWLPARTGSLHLALRGAGELVSICPFTYPEGEQRALLILLPDTAKKVYRGDVINPGKLKFSKGNTLLVNYSPLVGTVMLGSRRASIKPGERLVMQPGPDPNGMFRMLVAYTNDSKQLVPCYDRYVGKNADSRDILLLFPDPVLGIRTYSLPEFGPFE